MNEGADGLAHLSNAAPPVFPNHRDYRNSPRSGQAGTHLLAAQQSTQHGQSPPPRGQPSASHRRTEAQHPPDAHRDLLVAANMNERLDSLEKFRLIFSTEISRLTSLSNYLLKSCQNVLDVVNAHVARMAEPIEEATRAATERVAAEAATAANERVAAEAAAAEAAAKAAAAEAAAAEAATAANERAFLGGLFGGLEGLGSRVFFIPG